MNVNGAARAVSKHGCVEVHRLFSGPDAQSAETHTLPIESLTIENQDDEFLAITYIALSTAHQVADEALR